MRQFLDRATAFDPELELDDDELFPRPLRKPGATSRVQARYGHLPARVSAERATAIAAGGVASASEPLPFRDRIQAAFGRHDVSAVRAATGAEAARASAAIGARAYATGDRVAFAGAPDLHTAAHEAAHVIQQRGGVSLKDGVGEAGDIYEQHADRVADLVVRGESAEAVLDEMAGSGGSSTVALQRWIGDLVMVGSGDYTWKAEYDDKTKALIAFHCVGSPEGAEDRTGDTITADSDPAEWAVLVEKRTDATLPWPDGPRSKRKSETVPLANYLGWLRAFEAAYGTGADSVQRLRRLYYSDGTAGAGPGFDQMIRTDPELLPTCPPLDRDVLDGMFATDQIATPGGDITDVSHVFCLFDLALAGTSGVIDKDAELGHPSTWLNGKPGNLADAMVPLEGLFTWTGDLASWFVQWLEGDEFSEEGGRADPEDAEGARDGERTVDKQQPDRATQTPEQRLADLEALKNAKVSKVDLLGDMDAQALADQAPSIAEGASSMSEVLESYYDTNRETGVDRRFHLFVVHATPAIPFVLVNASPLTVALAPDAEGAIRDALHAAICALRTMPVFALDGYPEILDYIAHAFAGFLTEGLTSGDASW